MSFIYVGTDRPVEIIVESVPLTQASKIEAAFKSDVRNSVDDPDSVVVVSDTELHLNFQDTAETGRASWNITIFNATYPDGYPLTTKCDRELPPTTVCK